MPSLTSLRPCSFLRLARPYATAAAALAAVIGSAQTAHAEQPAPTPPAASTAPPAPPPAAPAAPVPPVAAYPAPDAPGGYQDSPGATTPPPGLTIPAPSVVGETEKPKPPPPKVAYSLPWQLRPVLAPTVIRSDTSIGMYEDGASKGGTTVVSTLTGSYKIPGTGGPGKGLAVIARAAMVNDSPPAGNGGLAIVNPLVGAAYAMDLGRGFKTNFFLGATIPVGMGGGDSPDPGVLNSRNKGPMARAAMDNALFAVNDFAIVPGASIAYVAKGFTVQLEATLFQLSRVRGEAKQQEATKTNFTSGIHFGYFVIPQMSIGLEARYQRWLNAPIAVDKDTTDTTVDNLTMAIGPRFHIPVGKNWVRPGVAYSRGLDKPMAASAPNSHIVQIDVPFLF